ncbi:aconitase/3-isopropylmalate dehydratase large subunit family protein [Pelobacter seleniigenes]|uniref:aconitase/3-isopropylmalate dehydratase large subunit family protein n=1 Tax=Pelobacter seleniigenes TaxID=407188 RepID=UPI0004A71BE5|nr:aconitase/3-isopropylmalate dehydratase large subunit family protein [Pelobacter seleniigenes]
MHALEKILARAAAKNRVRAGEKVTCRIDVAGISDHDPQTVRSFYAMGGKRVAAAGNILLFFDHYTPAATLSQAEDQRLLRNFCHDQEIAQLMDIDRGISHQVLADQGLSRPGELVIMTDAHASTHGALGAFGCGVPAGEMATVLLTGELDVQVPEVLRVNLAGELPGGVFAEDIIRQLRTQLGAEVAVGRAVEFAGPLLNRLPVSQRMTLCNMVIEMGALTGYVQPDELTFDYLREKGVEQFRPMCSDADYGYAAEFSFDVSGFRPQLAVVHSECQALPLEQLVGRRIDQAYLGTCSGGRVEDMAVAADILSGCKIHPRVRLLVVPASKDVLLETMALGHLQTLIQAGATLITPGCAACGGSRQGLLAAGETCIASANHSFFGQLGTPRTEIFLASPAAVAAAARAGEIIDPAVFLNPCN